MDTLLNNKLRLLYYCNTTIPLLIYNNILIICLLKKDSVLKIRHKNNRRVLLHNGNFLFVFDKIILNFLYQTFEKNIHLLINFLQFF